uniref:Transmembrane protein 45B n=2 Tax=Anolis carolinensis TaxID=28377 RepID=H9G774_ANOCA
MGYLMGHSLHGTAFLLIGFVWAIKHPLRFLGRKSKYSLQIEKLCYWVELMEWGGMVIICFSGAIAEQCVPGAPCFHLYNETTHQWLGLHLWQHSTVHAFFLMAGVVGVLTRCKFQIPVGLDYLLFSLALFNEGLMFYAHSHRISALDKYIHHILLIPILSGAVCSLFEVWLRNNPVLELFRTSMFITQGTWLWQIGFVLQDTSIWDHNDPETNVFMAICYSWHYASVILFLAFTYGIVYWVLRILKGNCEEGMKMQKFIQADTKTYTALLNGSDEE